MTLQHFYGCLYGGLLGDVFGAKFEFKKFVNLADALNYYNSHFLNGKTEPIMYTDDTEMALGVSQSLEKNYGFVANDMAKTFRDNYTRSIVQKNYGGGIRRLFSKLDATCSNTYYLSAQQYQNSGSCGNGSGMRIAPAALFAFTFTTKEFNQFILKVTGITHSHPDALFGGLLQAHAIRLILSIRISKNNSKIDPSDFIKQLTIELSAADIEEFSANKSADKDRIKVSLSQIIQKLEIVNQFLLRETCPPVNQIVRQLGNSVRACESIPTALFIFLQGLKNFPGINITSLPVRCAVFASHLGGDTDTIGCMACTLAGTLTGADPIESESAPGTIHFPANAMRSCAGLTKINNASKWLYEHYKSCLARQE